MDLSRRDLLRAGSAMAAAFGLRASGLLTPEEAAAAESGPSVIWLQAQTCTGCSVSFLNTIYYATAADLLQYMLDLNYHSTLMAGAGNTGPANAVAAAEAARAKSGYVLVVEGAVPAGDGGEFCYFWPGLTALKGVQDFAANAAFVIAAGTCASYGGMAGAAPNPTGALPLRDIITTQPVINVPGCPVNPDYLVGTIAYLLKNGKAPPVDDQGRPIGPTASYFAKTAHAQCPYNPDNGADGTKCLKPLGCHGPSSYCDCPSRKWNSPAPRTAGVNWCMGAGKPNGMPCIGCTDPAFPDGTSPFYKDPVVETPQVLKAQSQPQAARAEAPAAEPGAGPVEPTQDAKYKAYQQRLAEKKARQKPAAAARAAGRGRVAKPTGDGLDLLSPGKGE